MTRESPSTDPFPFENSYARLPDRFYARLDPTPVQAPKLIRLNRSLATELGLDADLLATADSIDIFAGNRVPGNAEPLAMAYAGHQFGNWVPRLGDGRAILLGELIDSHGRRKDIQLKGAGRTPFSRGGDGRAALGPVLREYILSEAMHALGVPTTRALAAVTTGEMVERETALPGAVLTRIASSHIRVGTFQFFASHNDFEAIRTLADHTIERHYSQARDADDPYQTLLELIVKKQAGLIAKWLHVGFIHGVMNTDNMSVAGETIDFGPCAFMDAYDPETVYSSIDVNGRYAYGNQPNIAQWNLARLAETLMLLLANEGDDPAHPDGALERAQSALDGFVSCFKEAYGAGLRAKLGLISEATDDIVLAQDLLRSMAKNKADFTLTFRRLCDAAESPENDGHVRAQFDNPNDFDEWAVRWRERLSREEESPEAHAHAMRAVNPAFIPRNHMVEEAIERAVNDNDFTPFETLVRVLERPFDDQPQFADHALPPRPEQVVHQTFCGT